MTQTSFSRGTPDVRWYSNSPRLPKKSAVLLLIQSLYRCNTDPGVCVLVWDFPVQSQPPNSWGYPTSHLIPWHIFPKETYNKCIQQWRYNPKGEEITWVHQMNPISKVLQHRNKKSSPPAVEELQGFSRPDVRVRVELIPPWWSQDSKQSRFCWAGSNCLSGRPHVVGE